MATAASDSVEMRLEHGARQRGDAQRLNRCLAEALAHLEDALAVALAAAEQLERIDAAHRVDEVIRQPLVLLVLQRRGRLRCRADQPHVEHDDRVHDQHDGTRHPIHREHAQKHDERHHDHAHDLRQDEARYVSTWSMPSNTIAVTLPVP